MATLIEELAARARALSPEDRGRLAEDLLASLQGEPETDTEAAWDREIQRRLEQVRSGEATLMAAEDVHAQARLIYK